MKGRHSLCPFSREDIILCTGAEKISNTSQPARKTQEEEDGALMKKAAPLAPLQHKAIPSASSETLPWKCEKQGSSQPPPCPSLTQRLF